jgi:hypothetical protein
MRERWEGIRHALAATLEELNTSGHVEEVVEKVQKIEVEDIDEAGGTIVKEEAKRVKIKEKLGHVNVAAESKRRPLHLIVLEVEHRHQILCPGIRGMKVRTKRTKRRCYGNMRGWKQRQKLEVVPVREFHPTILVTPSVGQRRRRVRIASAPILSTTQGMVTTAQLSERCEFRVVQIVSRVAEQVLEHVTLSS